MKLTFIGATHEVTGSCHLLQACNKNIFVDFGMQQGHSKLERVESPVKPGDVDYVFLTHAHIDHSGMLPWLYANGFKGRILTTDATKDLCKIMLLDSAHIQEMEAEWKSRKNIRAGKEPVEPIYTINDAQGTIELIDGYAYDDIIEVSKGIRIRFTDIGHLLGSASIEVWLDDGVTSKKIVFSGDVGNINQPLIKDPNDINAADYLVIESTYGTRKHEKVPNYPAALSKIIQDTFDQGGNVVIPSFAVGRTQEILYFIREIKEKGLVKNHDNFPVYVDSPLAIEATQIFDKNKYSCFDEDAMNLINQGINPIKFENLHLTISSEESKQINFNPVPKIIISASGMCEAGRIRHHLKHNLWQKNSTILFVGYQAVGTLGRILLDKEVTSVKLFGESVEINANIIALQGVSGHADQNGLTAMVRQMSPKPDYIFVVHGDEDAATGFADMLHDKYAYTAAAPYSGSVFDLAANRWEYIAEPKYVKEKEARTVSNIYYDKLNLAADKLLAIIKAGDGMPNKDMAKLTRHILALCEQFQ